MRTTDPVRIARLISESHSLADLEARLGLEGMRFRSRRSLRRALVRSWRRAHAEEVARVRSAPVTKLASLPVIQVSRDGVAFGIAGTAHGQRRFARMRPEVREELRRLLEAVEVSPRSDYATERGFARLLGLPKSKELEYFDALRHRIRTGRFIGQLIGLLLALPLLPVALPLLALSQDPLAREIRACLRDPRHIPRAARLWTLTRLPPPIRLALDGSSFGALHSEEMARAMVALASRRGLKTLTVLVGLGHADEIAYYLERPELEARVASHADGPTTV